MFESKEIKILIFDSNGDPATRLTLTNDDKRISFDPPLHVKSISKRLVDNGIFIHTEKFIPFSNELAGLLI